MNLTYLTSVQDWTAPTPPDPALDLMPENTDTFWEGLYEILKGVIPDVLPSLTQCLGVCLSVFAVVMLLSVLENLPGNSKFPARVAGASAIGILFFQSAHSLILLGISTVQAVSEYGKLLIPVMTAALAGSGGTTTSAALYAGTTLFDAALGSVITAVLVPMTYAFLCFSLVHSSLGEVTSKKLTDLMKWLMTWCLKTVLYIFTGFIGITGVVSGTADAAAVKAAKLTISGMVPVVGGILSDASEAVLVGADLVRTGAGVYGLLAVCAICAGPFLQIGAQYLALKVTGGICSLFGSKSIIGLIQDLTWTMGFLLAMTGAQSLILLVSIICFMRGVG